MATRAIRRPPPVIGAPAGIRGKYLSLTSFKRDGTGVATPLWFVADGRRVLVMTDASSFKAKRIRHNPEVMVAPCSATGRPRGEWLPARAEFLPLAELARVEALMARKYRFDRIFILPLYWLVQRLRGHAVVSDTTVLAITPV
jgi:PPOX class probable F420-dependent enzyme